jgi:hypothetical protein
VAEAVWGCGGGSAVAGIDYDCGNVEAGQTVQWEDGDSTPQNATIELLQAPEGKSTSTEVSFDVSIRSVAPAGVSIGYLGSVTVMLVPESVDELLKQNVRVTVRLSASYSAVTNGGRDASAARFREELITDVAAPDVLAVDPSRLLIATVAPALGGAATLATVLILEPAPADRNRALSASQEPAGTVATALVELVKDADGPLYASSKTWSKMIDLTFEPRVELAASPSPGPIAPVEPATLPAWAVAVICAVPIALCVGLGVLVSRNRRGIAEWVLWRAGNMRFTSLEQSDHRRALELELEEMERSGDSGVDFGTGADNNGGEPELASKSVIDAVSPVAATSVE